MDSRGELQRPWAARLVQRSCRAETLIQQQGWLSKESIGDRWVNISESGMVKEVECLRPQLQIVAAIEMHFPSNVGIDLKAPEVAELVAWRVAGAHAGR